jgi:N6-adenosine-specific RNA methylase IME4
MLICTRYPKLKELIQLKDKEIHDNTTPLMYMKVDLKTCDLPATLGCKFDVILIDPPWEEYRRRDPSLALTSDNTVWTLEEMMHLQIDQIADSPSFLWLWVGSEEGLKQGRLLLKKWGFRRCEDICWLKTNHHGQQSTHMFKQDSGNVFQHTKEHCLMGIKGTVRRNQDSHFIHANIDTGIYIPFIFIPLSLLFPPQM